MEESVIPADVCDLFIIESCNRSANDFLPEGTQLVESLLRIGKQPIFVSVKNEDELARALEMFKASNYRYLHLSCHGSDSSLTLSESGNLSYRRFVELSKDCFNDKRIFFSACELGNETFSNEIAMNNTAIQSVIAPINKMSSIISESFWRAFYTSIFKPEIQIVENNELSTLQIKEVNNLTFAKIKRALGFVIALYREGVHISYHETSKHVIYHKKLIPGKKSSEYSFFSKILPYNSFALR